jgi:hypothetical protein
LLLAFTAAASARFALALLDDPEGPNLLVVAGLTAIVFAVSLAAYFTEILPQVKGTRRALATIPIQLLTAAALYLFMR